jgi:hypothetical protein
MYKVDICKTKCVLPERYIDVDWGLVVKLALPRKVTGRAYNVFGIYDSSIISFKRP